MNSSRALWQGFSDELEKIAISAGRLRFAQSRSGRRPMRVDTLLRKEKEGTLYKGASSAGAVIPFAADPPPGVGAKGNRKPWEVPTRDDEVPIRREDGREFVLTTQGTGMHATDVGAKY